MNKFSFFAHRTIFFLSLGPTDAAVATATRSPCKKAAGVVSSRTELVRVTHFTGSLSVGAENRLKTQSFKQRGKGDVISSDPRHFIS